MTKTASKTLVLLAIFAGLLASAPAAHAGGGAGYNKATRALEAAFKIASNERIQSEDGCYPAPDALAATLGGRVAPSVKTVKKAGTVHVISSGTTCSKVTLAFRTKGTTWVLNSQTGNVVQK